MKAMKKSVSLLLVLLMALSVLVPLSAEAATVSLIEVKNVVEPAAGQKPVLTADAVGASYEVAKVFWYDYQNNKWLSEKDAFVKGVVYEANVHVDTTEGNEFCVPYSSCVATINGTAATVESRTMEDSSYHLNIRLKFTATENQILGSVDVGNLVEPEAGQKPVLTASASEGVTVNNVAWNHKGAWLRSSETFKNGDDYTAYVYLKAKDGYEFKESGGIPVFTSTVNGADAETVGWDSQNAKKYAIVKLKFTAYEYLDEIALTGLSEPKVGKTPDYSIDKSDFFDTNSVYFVNTTDRLNVKASESFAAGKVYEVGARIVLKDGYRFRLSQRGLPTVNATINGKSASVSTIYEKQPDREVAVWIIFPALTAETEETTSSSELSEIAVTGVKEPKAGEEISLTADSTEKFEVESVGWYNKTDGYFLLEKDKFSTDKTYTARVKVKARDGYSFKNPTATVNGVAARVSAIDGLDPEKYLLIARDFTEGEIPTETTTAPETTEKLTEPTEKTPEPTESTEETKPTEKTPEPIETTEPTKLTEPTETTEEAKPTEATEKPTESTELTQTPTEATTVTEPTQAPTEATTVTEPTQAPTEATTATDPTQAPTEATTATEPTQAPTEATTAADPTQAPTEPTEATAPTKPSKKENPVKVKVKKLTVKAKKLKKKAQTLKPLTVTGAKGKLTFKLLSVPKKIKKYIKLAKNGTLTFKRWKSPAKKTYRLKLTVTAAGSSSFKSKSIKTTVTIKVK